LNPQQETALTMVYGTWRLQTPHEPRNYMTLRSKARLHRVLPHKIQPRMKVDTNA